MTRDGHGGEDSETRVVARHVKQLRDKISFDMIGNLYFCEDLLDGTMRTVPTIADRLVIGVIVATFAAEENSRLPGNLRSYTMMRSMWFRSQMQRLMVKFPRRRSLSDGWIAFTRRVEEAGVGVDSVEKLGRLGPPTRSLDNLGIWSYGVSSKYCICLSVE